MIRLRGSWIAPISAKTELIEPPAVVRATDVGAILAIKTTSMATPRIKSISTKVTEAEYDEIARRAEPQTVSAWVRDILLAPPQPGARELLLLAEVLALRAILLGLNFAIATSGPPTPEEMHALIDRVDAQKFSKAADRIAGLGPDVDPTRR
jgi:hypothetical protein